MNREEMTQCMRDGCTYQQVHQINNYIDTLEQQNKKYKEVFDNAIAYLETKRIREKAIIDIDVLEGILKEVE